MERSEAAVQSEISNRDLATLIYESIFDIKFTGKNDHEQAMANALQAVHRMVTINKIEMLLDARRAMKPNA